MRQKCQRHGPEDRSAKSGRCKACDRERRRRYVAQHADEVRAKKRAVYAANPEPTRQAGRRYYETHREQRAKTDRAYYEANAERCRAAARARYYRNRDARIAMNKAWRVANRDRVREMHRAWHAANPSAQREACRRYRERDPARYRRIRQAIEQRRRGAPGPGVSADEWGRILDAFGHRCAYCGRRSRKLTQDHVIPIARGGEHSVRNVVPACGTCNRRKHIGPPLTPVQPMLLV